MIQLEQVRTLESKVRQAVELISRLKSENEYLKGRLTTYEVRIQELENLINSFRNSQSEIEEGIINALEELEYIDGNSSSPMEVTPEETQEEPFQAETEPMVEDVSQQTEGEQDLFSESYQEEAKEEEPTLGIF